MNKRGFLLAEETIKIIIALVCIIFLVYLLLSIYLSNVQGEKFKQASAVLINSTNSIKEVIERVNSGQGNVGGISQEFLVHEPEGWYFFSFVGNEIKPNSCAGASCLCLCDNVWKYSPQFWVSEEERQASKCSDKGVCLAVDGLREFGEIEVIDPTTLLIKNEGGLTILSR